MRHWIAICLLLAATPAHALTGVQLYRNCIEAKQNSVQDLSCISYVRGFIDGMAMGGKGHFCPPDIGISTDRGRLVAEKYLRDHLEDLHIDAGLLLGSAFTKAFPCTSN